MILYLIPFIVFIGFIAGYLIKKYIPEEQKDAQPYLFWAKKGILSLLLLVLLLTSTWSWHSAFFILGGMLLGFLLKEVYLYFSFSLFSLEFLPAVLCFLYGLVAGEKKNMLKNALFFFVPFSLLLLSFDLSFLRFFAAGALLVILVRKVKKKVLQEGNKNLYE